MQQIDALQRVTDVAVSRLLEGFLAHPFTHRVEHSLHVDLYRLLLDQPGMDRRVEIGASGFTTRLVHKEWPSTELASLRPGSGRPRRQSYDLAILRAEDLANAALTAFWAGRIRAAAAIEVGLDYSLPHLRGDFEKLQSNAVALPYIVHFSRKRTRSTAQIEELILQRPAIRTAFAHLDVEKGEFKVKGLDDDDYRTQPYGEPHLTGSTG